MNEGFDEQHSTQHRALGDDAWTLFLRMRLYVTLSRKSPSRTSRRAGPLQHMLR
jgi:hypothetical protein